MDEGKRLFYLPPGVDFASELVRGLRERMQGKPPEAMARVRLFLNSQRMRRRVTEAFSASGVSFLPRMDVVSDLQDDPILADLGRPEPDLRQRLRLARLVGALLAAQPELAPNAARFDLAESLRRLLAEMQDEGVSVETISGLDVSTHSAHWARTQAFLSIVAPLATADSKASRQREAVLRLATQWAAAPPSELVVIGGSTGSRGTTALFMQLIAGMKKGAVVVPGFDADLHESVWQAMGDAMASEDHPQYRFRRLMDAMKAGPEDFLPWRDVTPHDPARNRLISLALRPAPVTDQWLVEGPMLPDLAMASAGLTLIEATSPRDEASAIAAALRQALEQGTRAALITPDRGLSRRVAAALARWGIEADDSAGSPLALSPAGRLLRLVARAFTAPLTADLLLTMLKHPLAGSGDGRGRHLALTRKLELHLRRHGPAFPLAEDVMGWSDAASGEWAAGLAEVLRQLGPPPPAPLAEHVARHVAVTEALAGKDAGHLWREASGEAARRLMAGLAAEAEHGEVMSAADYRNLFETLVQEGEVREGKERHPLIAFYGHREAREMVADLVIMGGLTDGIWPGNADPDPWLNRKMRRDSGLLLPERQIGLSAHDFQQAIAARRVILSRAVRDAEAETVPSRWLNRLANLMSGLPDRNGPDALKAMRARGQVYLDLARAFERPSPAQRDALKPAPRPSPQPPVGLRPRRLSLTRISRLIRDPYAIYAEYVLRLRPLDPLHHEPDDRDRGNAVHKVLESFVKERPPGESVTAAKARLLAITETVMREETPFPSARVLWTARMERAADHLLRQDAKHGGTAVLVEEMGQVAVGDSGFTLIGKLDRIDLLPDGRLHLIDYKTGTPPTAKQQEEFDKQLLLAAVMAEMGGFAELGQRQVARISYIGLGAAGKVVETEMTEELLGDQWSRFVELIDKYHLRETGYSARRAVFEVSYPGDFDHLARFGEWQMTDRAVGIVVGGEDDAG
jgi:ATP-dependent helicase/nuclease subunit B